MLIDLHVHSRATAGCSLDPAQVIARAASLGLDGVAFTDLNTLDHAQVLAAPKPEGFSVFVGVEIATDHGHYLAFFPEPAEVPDPAQLFGENKVKPWGAREVLERVQSLGGVAVAAHPYDRDLDYPSGDYIFTLKDRLVGVEGLNARRKPGVNDLAVEASEHMGLPCAGGSGAVQSVDEVGRAATFFRSHISTHAELIAALKAGGFFPVGAGRPAPLSELARAPKNTGERGDRPERDFGDRDRRGGGRRGGRGGRGGGRGRR